MFLAFAETHAIKLLFYGGFILFFAALERWRPVERQGGRALAFNLMLFVSLYLLLTPYYYAFNLARLHFGALRLSWFGVKDVLVYDMTPLQMLVRFAVFLLVADFVKYWMHRAMHAIPLLWRFHRAHHSDRHFNASTNLRDQWLGVIYGDAVFAFFASMALGDLYLPRPLIALYLGYGYFAHSNLRLHLGCLTPVFVGPQFHRVHHSRAPEHVDKNFASFFPVFDRVFGTYYAPGRDEFPATGLVDETHENWWHMQLLPFLGGVSRPRPALRPEPIRTL